MNKKIKLEVFQAPCCNPSIAENVYNLLKDLKAKAGDKINIEVHDLSTGDEDTWFAFAKLSQYLKKKGLKNILASGPASIASVLPAFAINENLEFLREIPDISGLMKKLEV